MYIEVQDQQIKQAYLEKRTIQLGMHGILPHPNNTIDMIRQKKKSKKSEKILYQCDK